MTIPRLDGHSRVYAVFGDPVAQVRTPELINPIFARCGSNVVAVPFQVTAAQLEISWAAFSALSNLAGIGITVPHKVAAAALCDCLTPAAKAVGAVNCARRRADGTMEGALFDGWGFVRGLQTHRAALKGASVLLVGAGGAGRAIAYALVEEGISALAVFDIARDNAAFTVAMVNAAAGKTIARIATADLPPRLNVLINASPIGLNATDRFAFTLDRLRPETIVADIASLTRDTELLQLARSRGCATSAGGDMLEAQIELIAGFIDGHPAGTPIGAA